jgi:hypothetical protein
LPPNFNVLALRPSGDWQSLEKQLVVVKPPAPEQALNTDTAAVINSTLTTLRRMARFPSG